MIRREDGDSFLLIAQHDHALLAGELAEKFGNESFAQPAPYEPTIKGIRLHDCGWPLHDEAPTLNKAGQPIDVFESTPEIALKVWTASADRAAAQDKYAGLLTSLHVLSLSVFATSQTSFEHESFDFDGAVARFQHHELDRQQKLRGDLGLRTDKPSHHGLIKETGQKKEDQLTFNFRLLQAMDTLSLAVCCTKPPSAETQDVYPSPGGTPLRLKVARRGNDLMIAPWPFAETQIELKIPATRVPNRAYESEQEFRDVFASAPAELITARLIPARERQASH